MYRGWIFGTFAEAAPPLEEYLGDIRWGLDLLLEQADLVVGSVTSVDPETGAVSITEASR